MRHTWGWILVCLLATACRAEGAGALASITVIDRDSGVTLPLTHFKGEYWIAGNPGARYAIEIANQTSGRILAVTSVDGIDVLSGATAAWNQGGYVFDPNEQYQISGWRKTDQQVAAFVFTASPNSYAERTGRPANVGVIGVALFRERLPKDANLKLDNRSRQSESTDAAASAKSPMAGLSENRIFPTPAEKLGTGHGEREYSYVRRTDFERRHPQPDEVIRIRYDSRENLLAMGIIRAPHPRPFEPNPFPGSPAPSYVPDPPG
jgi:hypothetical protein